MRKEPLSIGRQMFWSKIFVGCLWIAYAMLGLFDNIICDVLSVVALVGAVAVLVVFMRIDLEEDDEMAHHNYVQAKAKTTDVMHIVFCGSSILSAVIVVLLKKLGIENNAWIPNCFFLLMGIQNIVTGLIFQKLEAE